VGYASYFNQTNAPGFELINNPLDNGTNSLISLFPKPPGGTQIQLWDPVNGVFNTATFSLAGGGHWKTNGVIADLAVIPPGVGYFISVAGTGLYTNTFVGQIDTATGTTTTNTVPGATFELVSSAVPYADYVTNSATINLTGLPGGTQIQAWNLANQAFDTYTYTLASGGTWKLNGVKTVPQIGLLQGFFLIPGGSYNWVQTGP
jgi:hypothetical protein